MTRSIISTTILIILFGNCFAQTEEEKQKIAEQTVIALKKWFENPSITNDLLDPAIIKQFQDSGRTDNGIKEGYWIEYSLDTTHAGETYTLTVGDKLMPMTTSATLLKEFGNYIHGKREGAWTLLKSHDMNAPFYWSKFSLTSYKNGLQDGEDIWYILDDKPILIRHFKNGIENGIGKIYDTNYPYHLEKIYNSIDGVNWVLETYYPNGILQIKYQDTIIGSQSGKYSFEYFESGKLKTSGFFLNGETPSGIWTNFYENGKPELVLSYSNGQVDGTWKYYYDNGKLWSERSYKNGKLLQVVSTRTKTGKKKNPGTIKNGNGNLYLYDENGNLTKTVEYVDGIERPGNR